MNKADREHFLREQAAKMAPQETPQDPDTFVTQAEYERFMAERKRIQDDRMIDLNLEEPETLTGESWGKLAEQGYDFRPEVTARFIKDAAADVVAYLESDRGQEDRLLLLNAIHSKAASLREYERIKAMVRRNGLYQKAVMVRTGNETTDAYIDARRRDIRQGRRAR